MGFLDFNFTGIRPAGGQAPWGDGFVDDDLSVSMSVRSWDDVTRDEYVRIFPRLIGRLPGDAISHVHQTIFAGNSLSETCASTDPGSDEIEAIEDLLRHLRRGSRPRFEQRIAEIIAFHTALHPAYIWAEALLAHQLFSTLGWLGIILRGRDALMPADIAEYLVESLSLRDREKETHPAIGCRIASPVVQAKLRRLGLQRLAGHRTVIAAGTLLARRPKRAAALVRTCLRYS